MAGIGIITNPHAKLNRRNPERSKLLSYIAGSRGTLEVTNNLEDLRKVAQQFYAQDIDTLAINGGDGTISRTITAFIQEYGSKPLPDIAVLRGGTMNMLADNLKLHGSPEQILYRLVEGHSLRQYMGVVEFNSLAINDHYGFLFANGSSRRFLEVFYKNKTSALGSIMLLFKVLLSYPFGGSLYNNMIKEDRYVLQADDRQPTSLLSSFTFCSTVEMIPLKIKLFPHMLQHPDKFGCLSVLTPPRKIPFVLPHFLLGLSATREHKVEFACEKLTITADSPQANAYTLDGELFYPPTGDLTIALGPKLRFIIV
jgi:diacylglycerol kinase family enzyme